MKSYLALIFISIGLSLVSTLDYLQHYATPCNTCEYIENERLNEIVSGDAIAPFAYRVLSPAIQLAMGGGWVALFIFHFVGRVLLFNLVYAWVNQFHGNTMFALLVTYVMLQVSYSTWYGSDYALTEMILLLAGWLLIVLDKPRIVPFAVILALAVLNREMTGFLLLLSWLVVHGWQYKRLSVLYGTIAACLFLGLQMLIPVDTAPFTVSYVWHANMEAWRVGNALFYHGILALFWVPILLLAEQIDSRYNRLLLIIIPYMGLLGLLASWQEVRLLMPIALLILPMVRK